MGQVTRRHMLIPPMSQSAVVMQAQPILLYPQATAQWIRITPQLAEKWISTDVNKNNRGLVEAQVNKLAADMKAGKWRGFNGEAIRFDKDGRLVDGQHRLWACFISGCSFETLVVYNVEREDYSTIGIGRSKSLQDFLGPMGGEKNVHVLASLLRLIYAWQHDALSSHKSSVAPTIAELQDVLRDHPRARISADWIAGKKTVRDLLVSSYAALIHYSGILEDRVATVETFLERLGDGQNLPSDSPIFQLRKFLLGERAPQPGRRRIGKTEVLAKTIKAWNATKAGQKMQGLRFSADEKFPKL